MGARASAGGDWQLRHFAGAASDLHAGSAEALAAGRRAARLLEPSDRVLVLGSTQPEGLFDPGALESGGLSTTRRRSGGSAVLVGPGEVIWLDLVVPAGDPAWSDDVTRAAWWAGEIWCEALRGAGMGDTEVWRGPLVRGPWSSHACFAGLGPGEVTSGGSKVVGVSQRRTPRAYLLQTAALVRWDPGLFPRIAAVPAPDADLPAVAPLGVRLAPAVLAALRGLLG